MKKPIFTGVCTALVTPFLNNQINYPLLARIIHQQIDSGVKAIVLAGTTGEAPTLSDYEKIQLFQKGKEYASNRLCVIAGTGTNSTQHAIALSKKAQETGVDALLVVSPYYNKGNPDGLYQHYLSIARAVDIPIILYNVPTRTGVDIPVSVYKKLSIIPNIAGVKEASSDIRKITQIRQQCGDSFSIWTGNDDQIVPVTAMGGKGVISVLSNIFPEETVAMTEAALAEDFRLASSLQCQLSPIIDALFCEVNPIPIKYAMKYAGFDCGKCRLPLGDTNQETRKKIDALFL